MNLSDHRQGAQRLDKAHQAQGRSPGTEGKTPDEIVQEFADALNKQKAEALHRTQEAAKVVTVYMMDGWEARYPMHQEVMRKAQELQRDYPDERFSQRCVRATDMLSPEDRESLKQEIRLLDQERAKEYSKFSKILDYVNSQLLSRPRKLVDENHVEWNSDVTNNLRILDSYKSGHQVFNRNQAIEALQCIKSIISISWGKASSRRRKTGDRERRKRQNDTSSLAKKS